MTSKFKGMLSVITGFIMLFILPGNVHAASSSDFSPEIYSDAFVVIDANTGKKLYGKNSEKKMYPASITKIITALIVIETLDPDEMVKVSNKAVNADGTRVYLLEDEEVKVKQLLHGLMVSSGNDAAIALAEHISGSVNEFARLMTEYVRTEVGVSETTFRNPHGLHDRNHVTTAKDMASISAHAMKNDSFRELVSTESVEWIGEGWETTLYNHHPLLRQYEEVKGVKNGFTRKAGYTLVTAAKMDETEILVVILNSPSRNHGVKDTLTLMENSLASYETQWLDFSGVKPLRRFTVPEVLPVTTYKDEDVRVRISDKGFLAVNGSDDRLISFEPLHEIRPVLPDMFLTAGKGRGSSE